MRNVWSLCTYTIISIAMSRPNIIACSISLLLYSWGCTSTKRYLTNVDKQFLFLSSQILYTNLCQLCFVQLPLTLDFHRSVLYIYSFINITCHFPSILCMEFDVSLLHLEVVFCAASTNVGLSQVSSTPPILLRRHCATLVTTDDWLAALHSNTTPGNWHPLPSLPHTRDAIYNKNCPFSSPTAHSRRRLDIVSRSFTRTRTLASPQSWRDFFTIAYNTSCMTHHTGMAFTVKPFHMCVY